MLPADVTAPVAKTGAASRDASRGVPRGVPQRAAPVEDSSVRIHIETVGGSYPHPELTSAAPGRTVFHGTGSAQMMAAVLRHVARQLDPPWWARHRTTH